MLLFGGSSSSSSKEIKRDSRLAALNVAIIAPSPLAVANPALPVAPKSEKPTVTNTSNKPTKTEASAPQAKNLPENDRPGEATQPKDIGAIETPSKFLSPDLLEQAARPVNDVWLDTSGLPIQQIYKVAIQVFVNSKGVVEQFRIIDTDLPAASIDAVFTLFHQTPFTPGIAAGQPQDSFVNLELDIDTFPQDRPRMPLLQPVAK